MSVSHCWETREHPDPCGHQLELVASSTALYHAAHGVPIWLFVDYTSLFQYQRNVKEHEDSFRAAMLNMHVLYAHDLSYTLRVQGLTPEPLWEQFLEREIEVYAEASGRAEPVPIRSLTKNSTPYLQRGWCRAELEWSSCRSDSRRNQRIDAKAAGGLSSWDGSNLVEPKKANVPQTPDLFKSQIQDLKFTHRSDLEPVLQLQARRAALLLS